MSKLKSMGAELKAESAKVLSELQTLRDEIKLKLHLASADGRDALDKLEPKILEFEKRASDAAESTADEVRSAGAELKAGLERIYQSLRKS
jgi:hypothetical protein